MLFQEKRKATSYSTIPEPLSFTLRSTFALIVAVDWFLDRCRTGDTIVARIIAYQFNKGGMGDKDERKQLDPAMEGLVAINPEFKGARSTPRRTRRV